MTNDTTQSFVPLKEIRDGIIVREDGSYCAILLVSPINFDLKSRVEREAILFAFQATLNSLEVGVQILIQSRKLNIRPYLNFLEKLYDNQEKDLLRLQTRAYIDFIKEFTETRNILSKQFFVIVPYTPLLESTKTFFFKKVTEQKKKEKFEEIVFQLRQRVSFVQSNIRSLGLRVVQLGTEEVVELLYQTFNPGDTQSPPK